jgi:TetR/AcrR family transcriptional regulator, transcriptional repressor for nem operon
VGNEAGDRPRFTIKGERTRSRIVEAAAQLIHERGVAGSTLDDIRSAAGVSGSQLSHYFANKDELVQAVIDYQAATITGNQQQADLGSPEGLRAWRDNVIAQLNSSEGRGGCPLGSLAGQLAETDAQARALIAAGFGQWSAAISDGLRRLHDTGHQTERHRSRRSRHHLPGRTPRRSPPGPGPARHPVPPNRRRHDPRTRPHHPPERIGRRRDAHAP